MTRVNPTTQARCDLGQLLAAALSLGEEYTREAEAQHAKVKADSFFTEADRRASLTEVMLSHRALAMLRPLAEMLPAENDEAPPRVPTAHRVVHPPAQGWSRVPDDGIDALALAMGLRNVGHVTYYDLHVADGGGRMHLFVDHLAPARDVFMSCLWGLSGNVATTGDEAREMDRLDKDSNPIPGETVVVRFSRLPTPPQPVADAMRPHARPPKCGACNDVDSVNCAVCGLIG